MKARSRRFVMKLSVPVHVLKQQAKALSRTKKIPLHRALDQIANQQGFAAWSLLAAKVSSEKPVSALLAQLRPGDLVLLGSRPGQGKTLIGIEMAVHTMRHGNQAAIFSLYCTRADIADLLGTTGADVHDFRDRLLIDDSDQICADYIIERLASAPANTIVVIDYLQLLDENRRNPDLATQVQQLRIFARKHELIIVCLSQIDRRYDSSARPCPGIDDVRLPNPLDTGLFDRTCFLNQGRMQIGSSQARRNPVMLTSIPQNWFSWNFTDVDGGQFELKPCSMFSRGFELLKDDAVVGKLTPGSFLGRRMEVDLPETLPLPVRAFGVWLAILLWKRDSDAAG
jgi:replicative DNA helicase